MNSHFIALPISSIASKGQRFKSTFSQLSAISSQHSINNICSGSVHIRNWPTIYLSTSAVTSRVLPPSNIPRIPIKPLSTGSGENGLVPRTTINFRDACGAWRIQVPLFSSPVQNISMIIKSILDLLSLQIESWKRASSPVSKILNDGKLSQKGWMRKNGLFLIYQYASNSKELVVIFNAHAKTQFSIILPKMPFSQIYQEYNIKHFQPEEPALSLFIIEIINISALRIHFLNNDNQLWDRVKASGFASFSTKRLVENEAKIAGAIQSFCFAPSFLFASLLSCIIKTVFYF